MAPLTDEQLAAMGLAIQGPDFKGAPQRMPQPSIPNTPAPGPAPSIGAAGASPAPGAPILPDASPQMPRSSLGAKIPMGAQIPTSHQQGKEEYQQNMPQIAPAPTAPAGTIDWQRQRQEELASKNEQADYKAAHPWGDAISAHPGILGKIGHGLAEAGNIAGDILAPGVMQNIPGTEMHKELLRRETDREMQQSVNQEGQEANVEHTQAETGAVPGEEQARQAQTEHTEAETAKDKQPIQESLQQSYGDAVQAAVKDGRNPLDDPKVKQFGDAITNMKK